MPNGNRGLQERTFWLSTAPLSFQSVLCALPFLEEKEEEEVCRFLHVNEAWLSGLTAEMYLLEAQEGI